MSRSEPSNRLASLLAACAAVLLAAASATLFAIWPWTGFGATFGTWVGLPYASMLFWLALYLAMATFGHGRGRARIAWRIAAATALLGVWSTFRVLSMGDDHWWRKATSEGTYTYAEPLSSALHALVCAVGGAEAIEWIAVVFGWLATIAWLQATDRLRETGERERLARSIAALVWVSSGVCGTFFARYVEHSQLGVPLLVLGLANLTLWSRAVAVANAGDLASLPRRRLLVGAAQLALAACLHLQFVGMLVAGVGGALVVGARRGLRNLVADMAAIALVVLALGGATVVGLRLSPLHPYFGSVAGGADGHWLVPPAAMFGAEHLALTANILLFAAPLLLPAIVVWLARRRAAELALLAPALAYCGFVATYGFDLGWPVDLDLMVAMSPSLSLPIVVVLMRAVAWPRAGRLAVLAALAVATWSTWSVIGPLVRPIGADLSQQNSADATLQIVGVPPGRAPVVVEVTEGDRLTLVAHGAPGALFWILKGLPHPVFSGFPYGSVSDIELPGGFTKAALLQAGALDESGSATVTWQVEALADGSLPALQMLVFPPGRNGRSVASAAFYLLDS